MSQDSSRSSHSTAFERTDVVPSTERNRTQSPLLRLSAELRNRIYRFALCGYHIHVFQDSRGLCRRLCMATHTDREIAQGIIAKDLSNKSSALTDNHAPCQLGKSPPTDYPRLPLSLLVVCRDINYEAALLPYQLNTFVIGSPEGNVSGAATLGELDRRLIQAQKAAIASISLSPTAHVERSRIEKFKGLQHLTVFGGVSLKLIWWNPLLAATRHFFFDVTAKALNFKGWKSVVICVLDKDVDTDHPSASSEYEKRARDLEQQLLVPWDEEAYRAELAVERKGSLRKGKVQSYQV